MSKKKNYNSLGGTIKHLSIVFFGTFFLGILLSLSTNTAMEEMNSIFPAVILLVVIIAINIIFDIIGVAVAVADISPFNARAARKAPGSLISLKLIKKSSVVSNFCCDVLGDVSGIVSGAVGAALAVSLAGTGGELLFYTTIVAGFISGLTVGGKALGKVAAINKAEMIMLHIGQLLDIKYWQHLVTDIGNRKEHT